MLMWSMRVHLILLQNCFHSCVWKFIICQQTVCSSFCAFSYKIFRSFCTLQFYFHSTLFCVVWFRSLFNLYLVAYCFGENYWLIVMLLILKTNWNLKGLHGKLLIDSCWRRRKNWRTWNWTTIDCSRPKTCSEMILKQKQTRFLKLFWVNSVMYCLLCFQ